MTDSQPTASLEASLANFERRARIEIAFVADSVTDRAHDQIGQAVLLGELMACAEQCKSFRGAAQLDKGRPFGDEGVRDYRHKVEVLSRLEHRFGEHDGTAAITVEVNPARQLATNGGTGRIPGKIGKLDRGGLQQPYCIIRATRADQITGQRSRG